MCFSLAWLQQVLVLAIIVVAVIAILKLVVPYVLSKLGATVGEGANIIIAAFRILLWAIVAIVVVIICFQIIGCLLSMGSFSLLPHR